MAKSDPKIDFLRLNLRSEGYTAVVAAQRASQWLSRSGAGKLRGQKAGVAAEFKFSSRALRQLSSVCKKTRHESPRATPRSALTLLAPPLPTVRAHPRPHLRPAFRRSAPASAGSAINVRALFRVPSVHALPPPSYAASFTTPHLRSVLVAISRAHIWRA